MELIGLKDAAWPGPKHSARRIHQFNGLAVYWAAGQADNRRCKNKWRSARHTFGRENAGVERIGRSKLDVAIIGA
ncbi:hypothetical protein D3C86_1690870 [compost metagenome]